MKLITVACAALNQTPIDWDGNARRLQSVLEKARAAQVQVLCLPELAISGYGCEDLFFSPDVQRTALEVLRHLLPSTKGLITGFGLPLYIGADCFNAVAVVADGRLAGFVLKQYLAREGLYYEPRWFRAWPKGERTEVRVGTESYAAGDIFFNAHTSSGECLSLGFEICEDAWAPTRPGSRLAARGVNLILNPSASHFAFSRFDIRKRFVLEGSRAFGVSYLYSNLLGNEAGKIIYDGSRLIACGGELVAQGERFSFGDSAMTVSTVDLDLGRVARPKSADVACLEGRAGEDATLPHPVTVSMQWRTTNAPLRSPAAPAWESGAQVREEEFARAQALGLFDYLRKSSARGFVLSLSGGADSATIACLVRLMAEFALRELGVEGVRSRLSGIDALPVQLTAASLTRALLLTVYQSTSNSSETTRTAAREIAQAVGAEHLEWSVQQLVQGYTTLVEGALGRKLDWARDDVALQNIQARVRAPGIWMLANVRGALLVSTSNRSEVAVGYATMDGDTAGGLSPLAGIDKSFIRRWLVWLEQTGPDGALALPALKAVNAQAPTAELRPLATKQTDEEDLMPYAVLNRIEQALVELGQSPAETVVTLSAEFGTAYSRDQLVLWIQRFMTLFSRNQWKRERYAPSFHMDGHNLDPRSWYRFPILSGGFARELAALKK